MAAFDKSLQASDKSYSAIVVTQFFKKWANPGLFFVYFCLFKQALQFLQQINVKNVIQCPAPGFELTTF